MTNKQTVLRPIGVSEINPVYDDKGNMSGWGMTVTYDGLSGSPLHVGGARIDVKNSGKHTLAEYVFPESVMQQGLRRAYLFRDAMLRQIAIRSVER